ESDVLTLREGELKPRDSEYSCKGPESERSRSSGSEPPANALAEAAVRHLGRLQRVTSALSEAVSIADVCGVLRGEMADALGAQSARVALASEEGDALLPRFEAEDGTGAAQVRNDHLESRAAIASDALSERLHRAFHQRMPVWPDPSCAIACLPLVLGT